MKVICYGASGLARKALEYLECNYEIVCWIDSDSRKQGKCFGRYDIKSMDALSDFNGKIIITSSFWIEISGMLKSYGISNDRIKICKTIYNDEKKQCGYEVVPICSSKLEVTAESSLAWYDMINGNDDATAIKVTIMLYNYSTYAKQLIENMDTRYGNLDISIISHDRDNGINIEAGCLKHVYIYQGYQDLKNILSHIPFQNVIQCLWIERDFSYFATDIREKCNWLNLNVGGSDFYRADEKEKDYKRAIIELADNITAENKETVNKFVDYYGSDILGKMGVLPFGVQVLEYIKEQKNIPLYEIKSEFDMPLDKIIISCGHNAHEAHQHKKMIEQLEMLPDRIKERICLVFPMTYPSNRQNYIAEIKEWLDKGEIQYRIITKFMNFEEMARYALASDVMIHVQITDQLSSTMLEQMYAGNIVIAGNWLPYETLREKGIEFFSIDSIEKLALSISCIIDNFNVYKEKCSKNSKVVYSIASWNYVAKMWYKLWINNKEMEKK